MTVKEYMNKFDELVVRCDIHKDSRLTLSRFRTKFFYCYFIDITGN